jgi:hypothetical protein
MEFIVNNKQKFEDFRKKYPDFFYNSYSWQKNGLVLTLFFTYAFGTENAFITSLEINLPEEISDEVIKKNEDFIFRIGLIQALSYWKAYCSSNFHIDCGNLNEKELSWWQDIWYDGMGEFRYRNNLLDVSKENWVKFILNSSEIDGEEKIRDFSDLSGNLIAFTGGKDSSLTLGLLQGEKSNELFSVNPTLDIEKVRKFFHYDRCPEIIIHREIHEKLLTLNQEGALNGHTPFSATVAFVGIFLASLRKKKYVIISNESSADEVTVLGTDINHQYSKSLIFENNFKNYCDLVWPGGPQYFSILRPFTEIGIISLLGQHEEIIQYISSCNAKTKDGLWCGKCAKCFFSFLIFSAVWDIYFAKKIIGVDMLAVPENLDMLYELTGIAPNKPFECVGTKEESLSSLAVIFEKFSDTSKNEALLKTFLERHKDLLPDPKKFKQIACEFHSNLLPGEFKEIIRRAREKICHE